MKPFEFNDKLVVKITASQANKVIYKIKNKIMELKDRSSVKSSNFTTFTINKFDITSSDITSLLNKVENEFMQKYQDKKLLFECQKDLLNIKEAIFKFNITHNISKKLSQIEVLKYKIEYYKNFKECLVCEKNIKKALVKAKDFLENSDNQVKKVNISIIFYDYEEIKFLLKKANKEILKLENEIALINNSNEIEISISKNVAELIGIG